jgi:hypothetical protein
VHRFRRSGWALAAEGRGSQLTPLPKASSPKSHRPYTREFRPRIVEVVRKGRTPEELARQFAHSIATTYGVPRIHAEVTDRGIRVGRKRVARLVRAAGLHGVSRRRQCHTTRRDETARPAPDLVERRFTAAGPNQLWVADITYILTWTGILYVAVVVDA